MDDTSHAILSKNYEKRKAKSNTEEYDILDADLIEDCQSAKENMLAEWCQMTEQLEAANETSPSLVAGDSSYNFCCKLQQFNLAESVSIIPLLANIGLLCTLT